MSVAIHLRRSVLASLLIAAVGLSACGSDSDTEVDDNAGGQAGASSAGSAGQATAGEAGSAGQAAGGEAGAQGGQGGGGGQAGQAGSAGQGGAAAGGGGAGGVSGSAGQAGGAACPQEASEPNDIESTAFDLQDVTDCDDTGWTIEGTLGPGDDDWYDWHAKDASTCLVDPTFTLKSAHNVTMCAYFLCDKGKTQVKCPSGSKEDTSINGRPGCCTTDSELKPGLECVGTSREDAYVWLHVGWANNTDCFPYEIEYHH